MGGAECASIAAGLSVAAVLLQCRGAAASVQGFEKVLCRGMQLGSQVLQFRVSGAAVQGDASLCCAEMQVNALQGPQVVQCINTVLLYIGAQLLLCRNSRWCCGGSLRLHTKRFCQKHQNAAEEQACWPYKRNKGGHGDCTSFASGSSSKVIQGACQHQSGRLMLTPKLQLL